MTLTPAQLSEIFDIFELIALAKSGGKKELSGSFDIHNKNFIEVSDVARQILCASIISSDIGTDFSSVLSRDGVILPKPELEQLAENIIEILKVNDSDLLKIDETAALQVESLSKLMPSLFKLDVFDNKTPKEKELLKIASDKIKSSLKEMLIKKLAKEKETSVQEKSRKESFERRRANSEIERAKYQEIKNNIPGFRDEDFAQYSKALTIDNQLKQLTDSHFISQWRKKFSLLEQGIVEVNQAITKVRENLKKITENDLPKHLQDNLKIELIEFEDKFRKRVIALNTDIIRHCELIDLEYSKLDKITSQDNFSYVGPGCYKIVLPEANHEDNVTKLLQKREVDLKKRYVTAFSEVESVLNEHGLNSDSELGGVKNLGDLRNVIEKYNSKIEVKPKTESIFSQAKSMLRKQSNTSDSEKNPLYDILKLILDDACENESNLYSEYGNKIKRQLERGGNVVSNCFQNGEQISIDDQETYLTVEDKREILTCDSKSQTLLDQIKNAEVERNFAKASYIQFVTSFSFLFSSARVSDTSIEDLFKGDFTYFNNEIKMYNESMEKELKELEETHVSLGKSNNLAKIKNKLELTEKQIEQLYNQGKELSDNIKQHCDFSESAKCYFQYLNKILEIANSFKGELKNKQFELNNKILDEKSKIMLKVKEYEGSEASKILYANSRTDCIYFTEGKDELMSILGAKFFISCEEVEEELSDALDKNAELCIALGIAYNLNIILGGALTRVQFEKHDKSHNLLFLKELLGDAIARILNGNVYNGNEIYDIYKDAVAILATKRNPNIDKFIPLKDSTSGAIDLKNSIGKTEWVKYHERRRLREQEQEARVPAPSLTM